MIKTTKKYATEMIKAIQKSVAQIQYREKILNKIENILF